MPYKTRWTAEALDHVVQLREQGLTLREIGERHGICRERTRQVLRKAARIRDRQMKHAALLHDFSDLAKKTCPHGNPVEDCNDCYIAADLAYDAARERGR